MKNFKKHALRALALLLITATLMLALGSCGKNLSEVAIIRSENFTVSAAMVTYSLYDSYYYYLNYFGEEMLKLYFGIDPSVSLQEQYSDAEKGTTWFDVFKTEALDGFCNALALCEAALEDGVELTDVDRKYIQNEIDEIAELAAKDGLTLKEYIKNIYGKNVTEEDIKKSLEIYRLANKKRYKDYNAITVSDSEINDVLAKEGDTYLMRDIIYFELTLANDNEKNEKIKEYAQKIKATTTEADFKAMVAEFVASEYCVNKDENKKVLSETVQNNVAEDDKTAVDSWFFASGTAVGSTYVYESNASCVVYMAVSEAAKDETPTKNLWTIIFEPSVYGTLEDCKAKADEVYALWQNGGKSMETFKSLASQYTTDYASVYSGGYYPNVKEGDMVDELDKWLFAEDIEEGASAVVKSSYGYHIMVYGGEGEFAWKVPVIESVKEEKTSVEILNYVELHSVEIVSGNLKYVKAK